MTDREELTEERIAIMMAEGCTVAEITAVIAKYYPED